MRRGANSCPAEWGKYFTAQKRHLLSPHAPMLWADLFNRVYYGLFFRLYQFMQETLMNACQSISPAPRRWHWVSCVDLPGEIGTRVYSVPDKRTKILFHKSQPWLNNEFVEWLARWLTWRQPHHWKGRCNQGTN